MQKQSIHPLVFFVSALTAPVPPRGRAAPRRQAEADEPPADAASERAQPAAS
jgi:hypothetical protein